MSGIIRDDMPLPYFYFSGSCYQAFLLVWQLLVHYCVFFHQAVSADNEEAFDVAIISDFLYQLQNWNQLLKFAELTCLTHSFTD